MVIHPFKYLTKNNPSFTPTPQRIISGILSFAMLALIASIVLATCLGTPALGIIFSLISLTVAAVAFLFLLKTLRKQVPIRIETQDLQQLCGWMEKLRKRYSSLLNEMKITAKRQLPEQEKEKILLELQRKIKLLLTSVQKTVVAIHQRIKAKCIEIKSHPEFKKNQIQYQKIIDKLNKLNNSAKAFEKDVSKTTKRFNKKQPLSGFYNRLKD